MWTESLAHRRCIVPTFGFFEPHQSETFINPRTGKANKQRYFFSEPSSPVLFIAGIHAGDRFSLMTTEPNDIMRPIHNRMPVVLRQEELDTWLYGDYLSLANRSSVVLLARKD
ncbi:MAG: SOS response-associated peptidase family protein [Coriobacteriales bacterium]|jgi:putative SOS response-associated peptidase YedK|nr:SOS response-associated peptidase family protein [Coriobacteriales bacterium]